MVLRKINYAAKIIDVFNTEPTKLFGFPKATGV